MQAWVRVCCKYSGLFQMVPETYTSVGWSNKPLMPSDTGRRLRHFNTSTRRENHINCRSNTGEVGADD